MPSPKSHSLTANPAMLSNVFYAHALTEAPSSWLRVTGIFLGAQILLVASAHLSLPWWPVPLTMQTFAVLLIALYLRPLQAVAALGAYLFGGFLGLPIMASTTAPLHGFSFLTGPTAGYLAGFLVAVIMVSTAMNSYRSTNKTYSPLQIVLLTLGASALILFMGWLWLATILGPQDAFVWGVLPFLPGDFVKSLAAAGLFMASTRFRHIG